MKKLLKGCALTLFAAFAALAGQAAVPTACTSIVEAGVVDSHDGSVMLVQPDVQLSDPFTLDVTYKFEAFTPTVKKVIAAVSPLMPTNKWGCADFKDFVALSNAVQAAVVGGTVTVDAASAADAFLQESYPYWERNCDFVISFNRPVKAGSFVLGGRYEQADKFGFNSWVCSSHSRDLAVGDHMRLLNDNNYKRVYVTYYEICSRVQEFLCGVKNLSDANIGTTMTVELRIYDETETYENSELVGTYEYTFGGGVASIVRGGETNYYSSVAAALADVRSDETIVLLTNNAENLEVNKDFSFSIMRGTNTLSGTVLSTSPLFDFEVAKDKKSCVYRELPPVCEIGATQYSSMEKAFRLATSGDTVRMIADATNATTVVVSKKLTLDLNGFYVTKKAESQNAYNGEALRLASSAAKLTVTDLSAEGEGEIYSPEDVAFISAGSLTVSNGTLTAKDVAIRQNGGTVTLAGGETRALVNAVFTHGGTLNVTGGKATASGTAGSDRSLGQAILIDDYNRTYYSQGYHYSYPSIRAVITGGEIGSYSNSAVSVYLRSDSADGFVTITGGKFRGGNAAALDGIPPYEWKIAAHAGLYSTEPHKAYVAYGYRAAANTNEATKALYPYTVVAAPPVASITVSEGVTNYYWKLERAIGAVAAGQTIDILADNSEAIDVKKNLAFSIDSHGHALTGTVQVHVDSSDDWRFVVNGDGTCSYCENPNVVKVILGTGNNADVEEFESFAEAMAYANAWPDDYVTIRLMKNTSMTVPLALNRSNVTLNLYGKTLFMASDAVFSIRGSNVLFKNGTLSGADATAYVSVTGSDVEANSITSNVRFETSGLSGNVAMKGCTVTADNALTARDGSVILGLSGSYMAATADAAAIAVPEGSTNAHVIVKGGAYTGALVADEGFIDIRTATFKSFGWTARNTGEVLSTGGTYDADPSGCVDEHFYVVTNSPTSYTVKCSYECRMVGEDGSTLCWTNLQAAVDMIRAGTVAAIVLTRPTNELTIPAACSVYQDTNGDQCVKVTSYIFSYDQRDSSGNVTNRVQQYCSTFEEFVKSYEDEVRRGNKPSAECVVPPKPTDAAPVGYKYVFNGTSYVVEHKIYTCQIVDASGRSLGKFESLQEAREAIGTLPDGAKITAPDTGDGEDDEWENPDAWFDESQWDWADPFWNIDPTDDFKASRLTKEGYVVTRIKNADNSYTYIVEIYVALIMTVTDDGPVTNRFAKLEDAVAAVTNESSAAYGRTIVVPNYDSKTMKAPDGWKFVPAQTGDLNTFNLVVKVYVCAIGGKDGQQYESFVEAIDALAAGEAEGELVVLNYNEQTMIAPNGWCFRQRTNGDWILAVFVDNGKNGAEVSLKASGTGIDRETISRVIEDIFVANEVEMKTEVVGVKLTTINETNAVGNVVVTSGVQKVVSAAKSDAAENARTDFVETLEAATNVTIKVDVAVSPIKYIPASSATGSGHLSFALSPTATVTVVSETSTSQNKVPVTNDMIDQNQRIAVSLYTGFKPAQIIHRADDGTFIKEYGRNEIEYDEAKGVATVYVNHFSTLTAVQAPIKYVAKIGETPFVTLAEAIKAAQSGDTIRVLAGTWGADDIGTIDGADASAKALTIVAASGATVKFTADVSIGDANGSSSTGSLSLLNCTYEGAMLNVAGFGSVTISGNKFTKSTLDAGGPNFVKVTGATSATLNGNNWNNELSGTVSGNAAYYTVNGETPALSSVSSLKTSVARVSATGLDYGSLQAAVDAAADGGTVVVQASATCADSVFVAGKSLNINLNGKTLTFSKTGSGAYGIVYDGVGASPTRITGTVYGYGKIISCDCGIYAATNADLVVENVTVEPSSNALAGHCALTAGDDATLTVNGGTFSGNVPVATAGVLLNGGRYNLEPDEACLPPEYVAAKKDGWWTVGYLTVDTAANRTAKFDSEQTYSVSVKDVDAVVEDETAAEAIKTRTRVEGVELTISEQTVGGQVVPPGVQAVVDAAKRTGGHLHEAFTNAVKVATDVLVKVDVKVAPEKFVPTKSDADKVGLAIYDLTPVATVYAIRNGVTNASDVVRVTNEMIDQAKNISVTFYTGFKPEAVAHLTDEGYRIEMFTGDEIAYDELTGLTTVTIHRFSKLAAYEKKPLGVTVPNCEDSSSSVKAVEVPSDWLVDNFLTDVDAAGEALNGEPVWKCYVLGMDPWSTDTFGTILPKPQSDGTVNVEFLNIDGSGIKTDLVTVTFEFEASAEIDGAYQKVTQQIDDPVFRNMQLDFDGTTVLTKRFFKNAKLVFTWKKGAE